MTDSLPTKDVGPSLRTIEARACRPGQTTGGATAVPVSGSRLWLTVLALLGLLVVGAACAPDPATDGTNEDAATEEPAEVADPEADPEADPVADPEDADADELEGAALVIYSGRSQDLVGPLIEAFEEETGIDAQVRWGSTSEVAIQLLEEGENTPADVFYAQDPAGLGAVSDQLSELPADILDAVDPRFRDPEGHWVGVSGRARVVVYNTESVSPEDLPEDLNGFTEPEWSGRIGWAPTNGSFQAMVTAMRQVWGEEDTRAWLEGVMANEAVAYENNSSTVAATGAGEVDVGFVNHYYLFRFLDEQGQEFPARNYFLPGGGPGSLVMVSGAGIVEGAENQDAAEAFLTFMLSEEAQTYLAEETFEYPLVPGVAISDQLTPLEDLNAAEVELGNLEDLEGTIELLREVGALP